MTNSYLNFPQSWSDIERHVHWDLWQSFNGLVVDRRWPVKYTIEMLRPPLRDLVLLWYELGSISTQKKRWASTDWTVDSLQTAVKVFHVILVCVTLDFIGSRIQLRIVHFPKLELNGAADAPKSVFLGSTLRIMEVQQVGSALYPYNLGMVFIKPVCVSSDRWP